MKSYPVAALLGFSAAGKSTLSKAFTSAYPGASVDICDTDKMIGSGYDGGHIYSMFLSLVRGKDRTAALRRIDDVERDFLKSFEPKKPTLVVAGPGLVIRSPEWRNFLTKWNPRCFYLTMGADAVLAGLRARYEREVAAVGDHRAFGSWNQDITTEYDEATQRWVLIEDEARILGNIRKMMASNVREYEAASASDDRYQGGEALRQSQARVEEIVTKIHGHLAI